MFRNKKKFKINLDRIWQPIYYFNSLKSFYFSIIPKGSKAYYLTSRFLRIIVNRFQFLNHYYQEWIKRFDTLSDEDINRITKRINALSTKPHFSIIMPVYNPDISSFKQTIQSVIQQIYPYWELCIADDASTDPRVQKLLQSYAAEDSRIKFIFRKENGHISAASNSALELATKEYIALLDHDDIIHPLALFYVAEVINSHPDSVIIFTDEDKISENGRRQGPYFKPDFDYELLLSQNMVSHLGVYRRSSVTKIGGFRIGLEGSQDYDLLLRTIENHTFDHIHHIPLPLYHWRISKTSVAMDVNIKPYATDAGKRAIQDHLSRRNINANVTYLPDIAGYKVTYELPTIEPSVTLIIIKQNESPSVTNLIENLLSNTNYHNFSIQIVIPESHYFNSTRLPEDWLGKITINNLENINCSYGEIINQSIHNTTTEYICLINENFLKFSQDWLSDLIGQASQSGVGIVAPKLIDHKDKVYSNGIILLPDRYPIHLSKGEDPALGGYFGWGKLSKGYTALSEKCLVFKREHWKNVGGMNTKIRSPFLCGVDFCLRQKSQGRRNILRPSVEICIQDVSQNNLEIDLISDEDMIYLNKCWGEFFRQDPAFNPNLTIIGDGQIHVNLSPIIFSQLI